MFHAKTDMKIKWNNYKIVKMCSALLLLFLTSSLLSSPSLMSAFVYKIKLQVHYTSHKHHIKYIYNVHSVIWCVCTKWYTYICINSEYFLQFSKKRRCFFLYNFFLVCFIFVFCAVCTFAGDSSTGSGNISIYYFVQCLTFAVLLFDVVYYFLFSIFCYRYFFVLVFCVVVFVSN